MNNSATDEAIYRGNNYVRIGNNLTIFPHVPNIRVSHPRKSPPIDLGSHAPNWPEMLLRHNLSIVRVDF